MGRGKTTSRKLTAREREFRAVELRKAGAKYADIADQLGYKGESGAREAVKRRMMRLAELADEEAAELRQLELARLDDLLLEINAVLRSKNAGWVDKMRAIDRALRISKRRSELLGLDAPQRREHTGADGGPISVRDETDPDQRAATILALADSILDEHEGDASAD